MSDATNSTLGMQLVEMRLGQPVDESAPGRLPGRDSPAREIADELGVNAATISRWMARFGIQTRVIGFRRRKDTAA